MEKKITLNLTLTLETLLQSCRVHAMLLTSIKSLVIVIILLNMMFSPASAQVRLVEDLNPIGKDPSEPDKRFTQNESNGGRAFFIGQGTELWTSDGTTSGTKIIKRFLKIEEIEVIGAFCFLSAQTDDKGMELWKSNGTAAGTVLLKDIYPGKGSSTPLFMTNVEGELFFAANNKSHSRELWKSDGTSAGTQLVKDIYSGNTGSNPADLTAVGGKVFFIANTPSPGYELWVSDGTDAGTRLVKDINPGVAGSSITDLTESNGLLYFSARSPMRGRQLWKSDGTEVGTSIVKIVNTSGSAEVSKLIDVDGLIFFQATDGVHGLELWRSDGTTAGTFMAKDLTPGPSNNTSADQHIMNLSSVNGKLFFMATAETPSSNIWISDGTTAGTQQLTSDNMYLRYFQTFHEINGAAYFFAMDMNTGKRNLSKIDMGGNISVVRSDLPWDDTFYMIDWVRIDEQHFFISEGYYWKTNGTTQGTSRLRTLCCPGGSYPSTLTDVNGTLYFRTIKTNEIWKSNGTAETTELILDEAQATDMVGLQNLVLMSARVGDDIGSYQTLWVTDGTTEGSVKLSETARYPVDLTASVNHVFFSAQTPEHGYELWKSNGTPGGTSMVKDISPGTAGSDPGRFVAIGDEMFFVAHSPEFGHELWISDGTEPGTNIVRNIATGSESSGPFSLTEFKGSLYFFATDGPFGVNGYELWKSDGTEANTTMVVDIRSNDVIEEVQYDVRNMIATDNWIFFGAINADGQHSLWKSNGTGSGTTQLIAFETPTEFVPQMLASTGDHAFFIRQFETSTEMWVADGSMATHVKTIRNEEFQSVVAVKGNTIYLITTSTDAMVYGTNYLWRSDGTEAGTYRIRFDGQPMELQTSGPYVYLSGRSDKEGAELFVIQEATHAASPARLAIADETVQPVDDLVSSYPNPFTTSVALKVSGDTGTTFGLEVLNVNGSRIMQNELVCNVEHLVGSSSWPAGMYVLKIKTENRMITKKIVKLRD